MGLSMETSAEGETDLGAGLISCLVVVPGFCGCPDPCWRQSS